ncbi:MAG: family 20 glycosylhydrolase [Prolixibacteraceae bacterium]|nr:family 20 glycosylhydrolase [Prolixibacteraceae bacterium]MBN2772645.1 family 20 glycosylhydrolase [Prolixibacteraceae bacterium]
MKKAVFTFALFCFLLNSICAEEPYKVRGLCIAAPTPEVIDEFVDFIDNTLAPDGVNTLILRVDYGYEYKSHPELVGGNPLKETDVKKLVTICKKHNIRLMPQVNLLGHQSWAGTPGKLLEVYPEFDETPEVEFPEKYEWPNDDGLYCKSYCPLHPEVHKVVFDIVDEIVEVFEADAFHAGMDEVFYIGHEQCSRCYGLDKAELFAGEVNKIRDHLKKTETELWIWGDRLIDGKTTGIGLWEASFNNTHKAIDLISKDVVICDWHYEASHPTVALFAAKGLTVVTCPWRKSDVALEQDKMTRSFIKNASNEMKPRYAGMMQTVWGSAKGFMDSYNGTANERRKDASADCFKSLVSVWNN